jgi:hypothetical protein
MKLKNIVSSKNFWCRIEEDSAVGFYLYVYDNVTGKCVRDHLQDTIQIAKEQAEEDYGMDANTWNEET